MGPRSVLTRRALPPLLALLTAFAVAAPAPAAEPMPTADDDADARRGATACAKPGSPVMVSQAGCQYQQLVVTTTCLEPQASPDAHCPRRRIDTIQYRGGTADPGSPSLSGGCAATERDLVSTLLFGPAPASGFESWRVTALNVDHDAAPRYRHDVGYVVHTHCDVEGATFVVRPATTIEFTARATVSLFVYYQCPPSSSARNCVPRGGQEWSTSIVLD